ncbi:hypothetical protein F3Y22_tig00110429pilonHSYRG01448 [Hibiscus syriacus]|uniref:Uncharacterized protein n=1 Tax=Hibiscus syriacus TaxID=106335 RepID=A0A6A3AMW4_HIBSY|nr:uncharacterized protein LOC120124961 [Hibiscus syriacus]KAE8705496.1 hypothetical protein F3Y22_tig00110429pilonHSYRG01448 [Hibiscus syriacus]
MADNAGVDAGNLNVVRENDVAIMEQGPKVVEEDVNMEERQQVENSKTFENGDIHDKIVATPTIAPKKCDDLKTSTSSSKKRTNSLPKSLLPGKASNSPVPPSKRLRDKLGMMLMLLSRSGTHMTRRKQCRTCSTCH